MTIMTRDREMSTGAVVPLTRFLSVFEKFIYIMYIYICAPEVTIFDRVSIISEAKTQKTDIPSLHFVLGPRGVVFCINFFI